MLTPSGHGGQTSLSLISKYFNEFFSPSQGLDRRKSRNLNQIVKYFELKNKNELARGIRTHDLTLTTLKSYPLYHKRLV